MIACPSQWQAPSGCARAQNRPPRARSGAAGQKSNHQGGRARKTGPRARRNPRGNPVVNFEGRGRGSSWEELCGEPRGDAGGSQRGRAGPKSAPWASMLPKHTKFYWFAQGFSTFPIKKCFSSCPLIHLPNDAKNDILHFLAFPLLKRYHFCLKMIVRLQYGRKVQNHLQNTYENGVHVVKVEVRSKN